MQICFDNYVYLISDFSITKLLDESSICVLNDNLKSH